MSNIVHEAYKIYLQDKQIENDREYAKTKPKEWTKGSLWPTDVGKCHRAAILRVTGTSGDPKFTTRGLDYMNAGSVYEDETANALRHAYGDSLTEQVVLKYDMWSGKADFGINVGASNPILIEHKMTSEKNWGTDGSTELPKHEHIGQAMTYSWLYEMTYGVTPIMIIFYKSWGNFAEFRLEEKGKDIIIKGDVNGHGSVRRYKFDYRKEIADLMLAYSTPTLPERLDKKWKGCTFMGKPSCPFYNFCWGE